jgi:hypothetical protein
MLQRPSERTSSGRVALLTVNVRVVVTGNGYNGSGSLIFEIEGESIKRLLIPE